MDRGLWNLLIGDVVSRFVSYWLVAALLVCTLFVRGGVLWLMRDNLRQDPDAYRAIAENLLRHGEFALGKEGPGGSGSIRSTAYRPPLYPIVLSNLPVADGRDVSLPKVAALHLALGLATVWLTWSTARRLVGPSPDRGPALGTTSDADSPPPGQKTAAGTSVAHGVSGLLSPLLAGFLVACDPILLHQQTLVMTETLAAFLAILALWWLARFDGRRDWFDAALAGAAIGLAILCRPTFLPWLAMVAAAMLAVRGGRDFRLQIPDCRLGSGAARAWKTRFTGFGWRVANGAALVAAAAAIISPWAVRNYRTFGKPIVTTTHGGYTFLLANNGEFFDSLHSKDRGLPWSPSVEFQTKSQTIDLESALREALGEGPRELFADRAYYAAARSIIRERPLDFLEACIFRVAQLWSPLPHKLTADESVGRRLLRSATAAWYCAVYALAGYGIWRLCGKLLAPPWIWGALLCLALTAVHTFYFTNLRMRAPLVPFVALVAAAAIPSNIQRPKPAFGSDTSA